ncbi:MAG: glutamine-synthetase adenylyltransferase, partial [Pseudopelagicola sp.]|nr:glutamine-synthetase adenylyltransferase [Pseudopelagicola sp.]
VAGVVLAVLWPVVAEKFAEKHGDMPGRGATVIGMGSLGARRLNAVSDLDLIVIYDADGVEASEGRRPLAARVYYARLTQAMVTALSAPMAQGRLYEVDMRLRPSGTQGPVATSLASFKSYQENEAWTWEHLALTRARPVAGTEGLQAEVTAFREALLARVHDVKSVRKDVQQMRERIAAAKAPSGPWDAKIGRGRLQEIELVSQTGALVEGCAAQSVVEGIHAAARVGLLNEQDAQCLVSAYELFWRVQVASKLLSEKPIRPEDIGRGGAAFLLRETGAETLDALGTQMATQAAQAGAIIDKALGAGEA